MVNHDAQTRNAVRDTHDVRDQRRRGIRGIEDEAGVREKLQAGNEVRMREFRADIAAPQVSTANAEKQRVTVEFIQITAEILLAGLKVADGSNDDLVFGGDIEDPLIIGEPWAAFDLNSADYSEAFRDAAISGGQRRMIEDRVVFWRPRDALRARRVEQVNMCVDDGNWRGFRFYSSERRARRGT